MSSSAETPARREKHVQRRHRGREFSRSIASFTNRTIMAKRSLLAFCTVVFLCSATVQIQALSECTFTGTSGFCTGMAGKFLLRDHNPNIKALYIVSSDLTDLSSEDFAPFQSLTTLHINNCTLPQVAEDNLLSGLKDLKALQITYSQLSDAVRSMFVNNSALNNLSLQWNGITRINKDFFSHLSEMESIDISHNNITEIEPGAFDALPLLKRLNVAHNRLGEAFDGAYLALGAGACGVCGLETCPSDVAALCGANEALDGLWRLFGDHFDVVYAEGNPACAAVEGATADDFVQGDVDGEAGRAGAGCTLFPPGACEKHARREAFLFYACNQDAFEGRKRSKKSHHEDDDADADADVVFSPAEPAQEQPGQEAEPAPGRRGPQSMQGGAPGLATAGAFKVMAASALVVVAVAAVVASVVYVFRRNRNNGSTGSEDAGDRARETSNDGVVQMEMQPMLENKDQPQSSSIEIAL